MSRRPDKVILVVDDFQDFLPYIQAELRDHGYKVELATDGQRGLELFLTNSHDLVLTNIHMPKLNGFQLLRAVKRISPTTPVILDTGFAHFARFFPEHATRADAFFEKPIDIEMLLNRIDQLLGFPTIYDGKSESSD